MMRLAHFGALVLLLAATGSAFAQAEFVKADPAEGSSVAVPVAIEINFSAPVVIDSARVVVKDSNGQPVNTGLVVLNPGDPKTIHIPLPVHPAPGLVTVDWAVVSEDGHATNGSYSFTIAQ